MSPFIKQSRADGSTFYTLKDDAPEGLLEAIREAHCDMFPNDWVWEECKAAYEEETDLTDSDALHEYADSRVDIYTKALFTWAADMCLTSLYSDAEPEAEELFSAVPSTSERFQAIQYFAIHRIATVIATYKATQ